MEILQLKRASTDKITTVQKYYSFGSNLTLNWHPKCSTLLETHRLRQTVLQVPTELQAPTVPKVVAEVDSEMPPKTSKCSSNLLAQAPAI
jgi:hypothetical protein